MNRAEPFLSEREALKTFSQVSGLMSATSSNTRYVKLTPRSVSGLSAPRTYILAPLIKVISILLTWLL